MDKHRQVPPEESYLSSQSTSELNFGTLIPKQEPEDLEVPEIIELNNFFMDLVEVKREPPSDVKPVVENPVQVCLEQIPKAEPESESESETPATDADQSESETEGCSPTKKFKRVVPVEDDSSSAEEEEVGKQKRTVPTNESGTPRKRDWGQWDQPGVEISETEESEDSSSESSVTSSSGSTSTLATEAEPEPSEDDEDWGTEKSYSSSEEEIIVKNEKEQCLVCENLGNINVIGRSKSRDTPWCKCGNCHFVGRWTDYDCICCREIKDIREFLAEELDDATKKSLCVKAHPRFYVDVLCKKALQRTGYYRTDHYGNSNGYMACWSFIRWIWNKLGWGERMVIPACVTSEIKEVYGNDSVQSFTAMKTCDHQNHCMKAQF